MAASPPDPDSSRATPGPATLTDQTLPGPGRLGGKGGDAEVTLETPGRYLIQSELARGGQSVVWVAMDGHLGREVAFKQPIIPAEAPVPVVENLNARFLREARITAKLEHPNIVPVYEIGRGADGKLYCTQKLILPPRGEKEPRTLQRALGEAQSLPERLRLLPHVLGACQAMAYAHEHGIIHRDIKPDNVVVGAFGETVVLDWGLAKNRAESESVHLSGSTLSGYALGTPSYMSPEQARGALESVDERSDVWSLGAMLYQVLTGVPPFRAETSIGTVQQVLHSPLEPALRRAPEAPAELAAVAQKALEKDPAHRYHSASALAEELSAYLTGTRVGVYRYSVLELVRLFVSRHRALSIVSVSALLLLAAAAALLWSSYLRSQRYLGEARTHLAVTLIEKARDAEQALQWDRAAGYYAAARVQDDLPEARLGAQLASNRATVDLALLRGNGADVRALDYSPDGRWLAVGSSDRRVHLWDVASRKELGSLTGHEDAITGVRFSPDGRTLATVSDDYSLRLWDAQSQRALPGLFRGQDRLSAVAFHPAGQHVLVAAEDRLALLLDAQTASVVSRFEGHRMAVYAVDISPDARWAVTAGRDTLVRLWDLQTGLAAGPAVRLEGHSEALLAARISPDGKYLATGGRDATIRLWRTSDFQLDRLLEGHTRKVNALAFSQDGTRLASGGSDNTVRVWDLARGQARLGESFGTERDVLTVAFSPDGRQLAWAGDGDAVWLRTLVGQVHPGNANQVMLGLATSPDGRLVAHSDGADLVVRETSTFEEKHRFPAASRMMIDVQFSPDGKHLAFGCEVKVLCVVDTATWAQLSRQEAESKEVTSIAFSPDGQLIASGGRDAVVRLSETATGKVVAELRGHGESIFAIAFSPDGTTVASGAYDKKVKLWDVASRTERSNMEGHLHGVRRVAFSPDGRVLASASWDKTVRLWDGKTGEPRSVLHGHEDHVFGLAFSPNGRLLASGARDGTLRLWDLEGRQLARFVAEEPWVYAMAFAKDGQSLLYSGWRLHRLVFPELSAPSDWLDQVLTETGLALEGTHLPRPALR